MCFLIGADRQGCSPSELRMKAFIANGSSAVAFRYRSIEATFGEALNIIGQPYSFKRVGMIITGNTLTALAVGRDGRLND